MKHLLLAFFLCIGTFFLCYSCREEAASTCPALLAADSMMWSCPDSALSLLEQIPSSRKLKRSDRALYALLMTQARYKSCVLLENDSLIQIAVRYYRNTEDKERLAESYFYSGCVHVEKRELPDAIALFLKSLDELAENKDSLFAAMVYSHLGDCYKEQDLYSTARGMYKEGYNLCMKRDSARACYALNDIGDTFLMEYQQDSTLVYYKQALKIASALQHSDLLFSLYSDIAALYNEQSKYTESEVYISKALLYQSTQEDYALACSTKGDILANLGRGDSAIYYWKIGTGASNIYVKTSSYNCLFQEYKKKKLWEEATLYADSFFVFYDSIQTMDYRAELDKLMDNHLVELYKHELSVKNYWTIVGLIVFFLLLAAALIIVYLWRDARRKKMYMNLQRRLMESRAEAMLLNEALEIPASAKSAELHELEEECFQICITLFEATEGGKKLDEMKKIVPIMQVKIANAHRKMIITDVRKTFIDVMDDLKKRYPSLTNDDLIYCVFSLLRCPKNIILLILDVSPDAIKVRKSRIKSKVDADLFSRLFGC